MTTSDSSPIAGATGRAPVQLARLRAALFVAALALAVAVVCVWHAQSVVTVSEDPYKFGDLGLNIAQGKGLRFSGGALTIRRAPLYPFVIAILDLCFGPSPLAIRLFQCLLFASTTVIVFEIGRRVFSRRVGLIAAAAVMLHPMGLRYAPDVQVETLLTFLYTLTVYRTVRLVEEESLLNGFLVGLPAAAAAMVKGVALPYPALFVVFYLLWRWRANRTPASLAQAARALAAMLVAMALVILPWTYRNYTVTGGQIVLISGNASGEFLRGFVFAQPKYLLLEKTAYTDGENEANAMQEEVFTRRGVEWFFDKEGLVQVADEAEAEKALNLELKQKLRESPAALPKKFAIAFLMFWYVVTSRMNSLVVASFALGAWAFAIYGLVRHRGSGGRFWLLLLPIVSLNAIYAAVLGLGRYSAPCIPALMVLAAFGIDSVVSKMRGEVPRRASS
jgi:4-amino-4-deoxy-L-arabinose transferase-like glycosyltransferase